MTKFIFTFCVLSILTLFFNGCFENCHTYNCYHPITTNDVNGKIRVDNANFLKDTINATDTLQIAFWGTIGNDSCYEFAYFQAASVEHRTDITLWNVHHETTEYGNKVECKTMAVMLNGIAYKIFPVTSGEYSVVIHQPDGSELVKKAYVR